MDWGREDKKYLRVSHYSIFFPSLMRTSPYPSCWPNCSHIWKNKYLYYKENTQQNRTGKWWGWKIWKNVITKQASQTWLLAVEESDLSFTSLTSLIQRSLLVEGLGPGSPISQPVFSWEFGKSCIVLRPSRYRRQYGEGKDVTAFCSNVIPSPIPQYLLMPKRRTPWNWGNLGNSTLSSETVLIRKWAASYLV